MAMLGVKVRHMAKYLASRLGMPPNALGIPPPSVASLGSQLRYFGICPPFPHNIASIFNGHTISISQMYLWQSRDNVKAMAL